MSPVFSPPTADTRPPTSYDYRYRDPHSGRDLTRVGLALFRHYGNQPVGRSVLKVGGVYATVDTPTTDELAAASEYYLGGHVYIVDETTASALTAAGYTVGGATWGDYTSLRWGDLSADTWGEL